MSEIKENKSYLKKSLLGLLLSASLYPVVYANAEDTIKLGIPVFLSGAPSGPFGLPEQNAAKVVIEALNNGTVPAPYGTVGFAGKKVEATYVDEKADAVTEYRNLVQRDKVDAVVGYTSSGNCKAIAPLAEELKKLTVFIDCGTPQIFEKIVTDPKYLFRTGPTGTIDSVGAARYLKDSGADISKVAGINQNYAWGQDNWNDFVGSLKALKTDSKVVSEQFPKVYAGQYGAEISALLTSGAGAIHNSFWGGDLEAFILQAAPRGLFKRSAIVMSCGEAATRRLPNQIPKGAIIGARGPHSYFAEKSALSDWFKKTYQEKYNEEPSYPAWKMAQALFGLKSAWEKAAADGNTSQEAVAKAFAGLEFDSPSGVVKMKNGKGHQAIQGIAYGTYTKDDKGNPAVENIIRYSAECVNPPADMTAQEWIEAGFPNSQCN